MSNLLGNHIVDFLMMWPILVAELVDNLYDSEVQRLPFHVDFVMSKLVFEVLT